MALIKCMLFFVLCNVALAIHKPKQSSTGTQKTILLVDSGNDCEFGSGRGGLHGKLFGGHRKLGGHFGHGGLKGHEGLIGHGGSKGFGGHGGHGAFKGLSCGGCGACSECRSLGHGTKMGHCEIGSGIEQRQGKLLSGHGSFKPSLTEIVESKKSQGHGGFVGAKPPVIIVEEEASNCDVNVEVPPVTIHKEACNPKIVGDATPVRLVHHAQPFLIQSYEKPLIIDHYKKAVVENHNPQPVILDHMAEPAVQVVQENQGCLEGFGGGFPSTSGFSSGGGGSSSGCSGSSGSCGQGGGYPMAHAHQGQLFDHAQQQYSMQIGNCQQTGCQKCR